MSYERLEGYNWIEKSAIVSAIQIDKDTEINTANGIRTAKATDWIVRDISGRAHIVHDVDFHERYEQIFNKEPMTMIMKGR